MTPKDYILLANALHESRPEVELVTESGEYWQWKKDLTVITLALKSDNSGFDHLKFTTRAYLGN